MELAVSALWAKAWKRANEAMERTSCPCLECCDDALFNFGDEQTWGPFGWYTANMIAASLILDGAPISELP